MTLPCLVIAGIFMGVYIVRHYWDQSAYFRQPAQGYQAYSSPNTASLVFCTAVVGR